MKLRPFCRIARSKGRETAVRIHHKHAHKICGKGMLTYIVVLDWEEDETVLVFGQERLSNILLVLLNWFSGSQSLLDAAELIRAWNLGLNLLHRLQVVKEILAG